MTTQQAILDIVTYQTLPSQIDYQLPYQLRAIKADQYLTSLPTNECLKAYEKIGEAIDIYYTEIEDIGFSPSELAELL